MNKGLFSFPKQKLSEDKFFATDLQLLAGGTILTNELVCMRNGQAGDMPLGFKSPWSAGAYDILPSGGAAGVLQGSVTQTNSATTSQYSAATAFSDGSFAIISGTNTGTPSYSIYNADGSARVALTTIEGTAPTWHWTSACTLNSNEFVVLYPDNSSYPKFARYSSAGVLQGSQTLVSTAGCTNAAVAALANGGFVTAYRDNGGFTYARRWDATGTSVGGVITVEAVAPNATACAGLPNGDFVVAYLTSSNIGKFARYNSSGVLQGSLTTFAASSSTYVAVASLPNGNFVIGTFTSGSLVTKLYDGANTLLSTTTTSLGGGSGPLHMAGGGYGEFAAYTVVNMGSSGPGIVRFTDANVVTGMLRVEGSSLYSVGGVIRPDGQHVIAFGLHGGVSKYARYTGVPAVIVGVAVESASAGNFVRVRPCGVNGFPISMKLPTALTNLPATFDHRTLGGIAGAIAGNAAYLRGFA